MGLFMNMFRFFCSLSAFFSFSPVFAMALSFKFCMYTRGSFFSCSACAMADD